ncbi:acid phosphatase 1-like [Phragmites australis]|uniref:acid phosphatase 1-like n=1 Tax=Phragmites australis TaxID=29695 RepID=UPI002D7655C5|nr:acid phosphatase 1-like [Phragmites australis]
MEIVAEVEASMKEHMDMLAKMMEQQVEGRIRVMRQQDASMTLESPSAWHQSASAPDNDPDNMLVHHDFPIGEFEEVAARGRGRAGTFEEADAAQQHLLPHPLVIEIPTSATTWEANNEGLEEVSSDVRCASWRLAADANNLVPWKAVPVECATHVRDYVTGVAYRFDLEPIGDDAWVFDVNKTLLSNLPYYVKNGYGGEAPAIPSSLKLYKEVHDLGFKTFLLTGRSEAHQGVTVDNLNKECFHDSDKLIRRYLAV